MSFTTRGGSDIREIQCMEGKTYYLQRSAHGLYEEYTFYNAGDGAVLESFTPDTDGHYDGVWETEDYMDYYVEVNGDIIKAKFSNAAFFDTEEVEESLQEKLTQAISEVWLIQHGKLPKKTGRQFLEEMRTKTNER